MYDSFFFLMYVKESRSRFVKDYYSLFLNYVVMASILVCASRSLGNSALGVVGHSI